MRKGEGGKKRGEEAELGRARVRERNRLKKCGWRLRQGGRGGQRNDKIDNQKLKAAEWEDRKGERKTMMGKGRGGAAKREGGERE